MDTIKTQAQQSLLDVATQHCGGIGAVMELAKANGLSVTDDVTVGSVLMGAAKVDERTAEVYAGMVHKPATALTAADSALDSQIRVFDDTFTQQFE